MQYTLSDFNTSEQSGENTNTEKNIEIEIEIDSNSGVDSPESSLNFEERMGSFTDIENDNEKESRFKDGEILNMIRVRFPGNSKSFPFLVGKRRFAYGQKVVAMSDRGMTVGYINSFTYEIPFNKSMLPVRSIAKVASLEDIKAQKDFRDSEKRAEVICLHLIEKHKLDMILTHVEFIQFGKKAVFYFNAPERVDFRELVKDLVQDLKMRIELRQISVRDRAAALGAIGACGLQTCCSSFLKAYGNVSIKMAKNQNLALIPSKLNGVCGQIKCCIKYEDDVYADKRKNLPKEGSIIKVKNGDTGKVLKLHLLVEQFELLTDFGAKRRYAVNQFVGENNLSSDYRFPESFEHIVDETKEVIGLIKEQQLRSDMFINSVGDQMEEEIIDENDDDDANDDDFEDDKENNELNNESDIDLNANSESSSKVDEKKLQSQSRDSRQQQKTEGHRSHHPRSNHRPNNQPNNQSRRPHHQQDNHNNTQSNSRQQNEERNGGRSLNANDNRSNGRNENRNNNRRPKHQQSRERNNNHHNGPRRPQEDKSKTDAQKNTKE